MCKVEIADMLATAAVRNRITSTRFVSMPKPITIAEHNCAASASLVGILITRSEGAVVEKKNVSLCSVCFNPVDNLGQITADCCPNTMGHRALKKGMDVEFVPSPMGLDLGFHSKQVTVSDILTAGPE